MKNYKTWFVTDEHDVDDTLQPGKLKIEFSQASGNYIGLTPKTYMCLDLNGAKKAGQKGIPRTAQIHFQQFSESLYDNKQFSCETHSLQTKVFFFFYLFLIIFLETKNVTG